jgi:hypothetical protein
MRQIGVRDEAKLLADYGDCGCAVCCNTHLVQMPPVSMRMAKLQKATLDPTKISGRCGRLKCCLRYEYDSYEQSLHEQKAHPAGEPAANADREPIAGDAAAATASNAEPASPEPASPDAAGQESPPFTSDI